jgi:hypothetical protein
MKTKAHTRYVNKDGKIVPGVTTILGILSKPALVPWANRLGLEGIDVKKFVDDKADIGTLAHAICTDYLMGVKTDYSHYDQHQISLAENAALSFFSWLEKNPIHPVIIEGKFVNQKYGGTADIYGILDGKPTLIDLKTGSGIWPEYLYQVAAYRELLQVNGYEVAEVRVLNIPRVESEKFKEEPYTDKELELGLRIFNDCLDIYEAKKQLK